MDPIHPIVPTSPTIPPVTPAPLVGRLDRDQPRGQTGDQKRRRRPAPAAPVTEDRRAGGDPNAREADGDSGLHINVTV